MSSTNSSGVYAHKFAAGSNLIKACILLVKFAISEPRDSFRIDVDVPSGNGTFVTASDFRSVALSILGVAPGQEYELRITLHSSDVRVYSLQLQHDFEWSMVFNVFVRQDMKTSTPQVFLNSLFCARSWL